jgi:hypothetical protein
MRKTNTTPKTKTRVEDDPDFFSSSDWPDH